VHLSTEYTFDGVTAVHTEEETPSPLGVYGQSKAAGDAAVSVCPQHYLVRTSWVVGDGKNFVKTMLSLAERGATLLVSSHVMDEAFRCDQVLLMRQGRILATTTAKDLLASTGAETVDAAFLAVIADSESRPEQKGGQR